MPKYILHGGYPLENGEMNDRFHAEMASQIPKGGVWLGVYFGKPSRDQESYFAQTVERMKPHLEEGLVEFLCATEERFSEQAKNADVIYIFGGLYKRLVQKLKRRNVDVDFFGQNKVFAGESAGAAILAMNAYSVTAKECVQGFGVLPFDVHIHHGNPEFDAGLPELRALNGKKRPLVLLPEGEFVTIEM